MMRRRKPTCIHATRGVSNDVFIVGTLYEFLSSGPPALAAVLPACLAA
jgi:hypothetical protein